MGMHLLFIAFGLVIASCGTNSSWYQRFEQSRTMTAPSIQVAPADPLRFTFAIVGDLHVGGTNTSRFRQILAAAQNENDQFIVLLGDITDRGEADAFQAVQQALTDYGFQNKVLPILGNHDVFSQGWDEYKKIWGPAHYRVTFGNAQLIALDSADGILGEEQFDWLQEQFQGAKPTHTFLLTHYMPVVPGQRTYLRLANQSEAERLMKLASREGVRSVLGGHYHSYCREQIAGVEYVVAGGGGGRRMDPIRDYFFVQVRVDGESVTYELRTLP